MKELLIILVSSAIVHNVVLSQFLGLCPFFGVSKKTETAVEWVEPLYSLLHCLPSLPD